MGSRVISKFEISEEKARTVQFFSNKPAISFLSKEPSVILPGARNEVQFVAAAKSKEEQICLVNAVDVSSKLLLNSWLVRIYSDQPEITRVVELKFKVGHQNSIQLEFSNPINGWVVFAFESSNEDLLKVLF